MFGEIGNLKEMYDAIKDVDLTDPVATLKKLGMSEEEAKAAVGKMEDLKKTIVEKTLNGGIKTAEDVMNLVKESGIIPQEHFDKIMESIGGKHKSS